MIYGLGMDGNYETYFLYEDGKPLCDIGLPDLNPIMRMLSAANAGTQQQQNDAEQRKEASEAIGQLIDTIANQGWDQCPYCDGDYEPGDGFAHTDDCVLPRLDQVRRVMAGK